MVLLYKCVVFFVSISFFVTGCVIKHAEQRLTKFSYVPTASFENKKSYLILEGKRNIILTKPIDKRKQLTGDQVGTYRAAMHSFPLITEGGEEISQILRVAIRKLLESRGFEGVFVAKGNLSHKVKRSKADFIINVEINKFEIYYYSNVFMPVQNFSGSADMDLDLMLLDTSSGNLLWKTNITATPKYREAGFESPGQRDETTNYFFNQIMTKINNQIPWQLLEGDK